MTTKTKAKPKFVYDLDELNNEFHFFGTSVGEWCARQSLDEVLDIMKKGGLNFSIYRVPLPVTAPYEISMYRPKVEGALYLGHWQLAGQ